MQEEEEEKEEKEEKEEVVDSLSRMHHRATEFAILSSLA
jgi:hypothetical protein